MNSGACFRSLAYYRLSEKDKLKTVSDSIENQRKLIHEFVSRHEDIELVDEFYDDGYTGTNYARPGFCAVMDKVKTGDIDCIIVKDLSRLGREYIETGRYIEETFPSLGIRFIAVNDDYDSGTPKDSDDLMIPIKNLMNETYCRELSNKLRRQFAVQRSNGEYLGAFAAYGYLKSPEDKHKLTVDTFAAEIVRSIFYYKLQGYSQQAIANTLNSEGVLSPAEYKKQQGLNYKTGFGTSKTAVWSAATVTAILKNRLYIGELIQGKRGTPNFKLKVVRTRPSEEWVVVQDNHEAIVDPLVFDTVQKMLERDTRTSPLQKAVYPLGGLVFCADCSRPMLLRSVTRNGRKFQYYICTSKKRGLGCTSHSFERNKLESAILNAIRLQISIVVELQSLLQSISASELFQARRRKITSQIEEKEKERVRCEEFRNKLLEALNEELIDRNEYERMRDKYRSQQLACESAIDTLNAKLHQEDCPEIDSDSWIGQYLKYRDLQILTREAVVTLVDKILVHEDKRIEIIFNYRDELAYYQSLTRESAMKEVG